MAMTNSFGLYNSEFSAIKFGFLNEVGYIAISPVFDKFRGKKPKKGMNMYDHENRILFYLRQDEIAKLLMNWKGIISGEIDHEVVINGGVNSMTTKLTVGCGVFDIDDASREGMTKKKSAPFQIAIEKFDEYNPNSDNEALESYIFQAKDDEKEIAIYLFEKWLDVMMNFIVSGVARHISAFADEDGGKSGFNKFSRGKSKFSRSSSSSQAEKEEDDTDEDDMESSSPRKNFGRNRGQQGKAKFNRTISEDEVFADDDDES